MNWYRQLVAQVTPGRTEEPQEPEQPQSAPEPTDAMLAVVVNDALSGRNIAPLASGSGDLKVAGVTGHFRHKFFFDAFRALPNEMKDFARKNFKKMIANPQAVGLKRLPGRPNASKVEVYSAQVGYGYRALAVKVGSAYVWYWIGTHEEYNRKKDAPVPAVQTPPQPTPSVNPKAEIPRSQDQQKSLRQKLHQ